ncbi:MAG: hypothetical protein IJP92_06660, partial [Lachnospiraceae bacterium]|nr:hypothetical protein [Lachnospiraceae bacterium]
LNVYVVDFSAKMLAPFEKGPHVGGVLTEEDGDKIDKFFVLIQEIISRRKALFKGGNYSQFIRSRGRNDEAAILVLFDNYGNFRNRTGMAYDDVVLQLAKEGNAYGIYLAFSGTSFQNAEIPAKLAETLKTTFALEMNDKYHYIEVVRSSHIDIEPEQNVKGRGIVKIGDRLLEYQTALSMDAEDDFARGELLEKVIQQMGQAWSGKHAMQIPTIPEKPVLEEFMQLDEVRSAMEKGDMLPIGYDAKYATIFSINLTRVSTYLITGKTRTGRSNLMKLLMYVASEKRGRHVVFDFDGELESLTQKLNMEQVSSASGVGNFFAGIFEDIKERSVRRKELIKEGVSEDEIYAEMSSFEPLYLFIGKLSSFITQVEKTKDETDVQDVSGFVGNILDKGDLIHVYWFADFNTDESVSMNGKTLYNMIIKRKTGLHLGGNVASQNIFSFNYMPFSEQSKSLKAGIGLVPEGDDEMRTRRVVIPLVKG